MRPFNCGMPAKRCEAAQVAQDLSQRRLEAEQSKFEVGMSTNYFVVQAQRDMNESRNSELRAVLNYRKALVEFERLQQTTLQSSNITVLQAGGGDGTATQGGGGGAPTWPNRMAAVVAGTAGAAIRSAVERSAFIPRA